jgi:aminoglycoside phosphotransferase (APT) family kinase protein
MASPRGVAVSRSFHDRERMLRAMEQLRLLDREGPRCLLHGDCHLGNLYLEADGTPGFLDWQSVRQGPWVHDVAYFLGSALDIIDRPRWERTLLEHYLCELASAGIDPPPFDGAWANYGCQMVYGLFYWLVNPVEFQTELNNCAVAPRFAMAAIDHRSFEQLLGGAEEL